MRWVVMQSMKSRRWVLAVIDRQTGEYQVTDLASDRLDKVVQYADYLNDWKYPVSLPPGAPVPKVCSGAAVGFTFQEISLLENLREKYQPGAEEEREVC